MARKIRFLIFFLLWLFVVSFIFYNSFQSGEASNAASGWVADFLRPILNPRGRLDEDTFHALIRKLAHFVEFGALGVCLGGMAANALVRRRWLYAAVAAAATAFADESIQYFTGRYNSIKDVGIDCSGAACGLLFVWLILLIIKRYKERRTWQN